ncbi:MAG TPA: SDR family oxidoreductase [Candidatus Binatia bacterium]|nr:SDR family oxidoreductase [Candidatus Binatia bacterium]
MAERFAGRVAFVTGAGSGIGRATASLLALEGARVFAVDVNRDGLSETVGSIRAAGGQADGTHCDVTDPASVQTAVERTVAAFGGLNILVNVAGIGGFLRFEELELADWQRTLAVNMTGAFITTKAALPHLLTPPAGNVVNVASTSALRGVAYAPHYAASKAGLLNLTRSLALEFATRDLRFNCVCPGGVRTPLGRFFIRREDFEAHLIDYAAPPKPGNFADPIDIARIIAFLASDDARMINGAALTADGGTLA